jgi:hypothetical protein
MVMAAVLFTSCDMPDVPVHSDIRSGEDSPVARIRISALTEFIQAPAMPGKVQIKTLLEVIDPLNKPVKIPFMARFELYEFQPLSSDPRGRRLAIWPEQDLRDSGTNDEHWQDFLCGYEFYLPLEFVPQPGKKYLFEVSCLAGQRRFHDLFNMQYQP